ncbi:hypothetical protein HN789_00705 [archaeon]|mgnify:CR=1 FL=1|jgi:hypothetical protein|nr:hypothetical protein [archaeon]MBT4022048.1 hypothetical protein [archaeon]MBT4272661.1 hypothetical protein [archaeon]MBT4461459.1 hypothetical protein [archaeon]MBT4857771.1 hypothetical protein [archaeon]
MKNKSIVLLFLVTCFFIFKPLLLLFIPGLLILFYERKVEKIILKSIPISLSFWIVSFWFLRFIRIPLDLFFYIILILSILVILVSKSQKIIFKNPWILLGFFIVIVIRLLPFFLVDFPSGADMSYHTLNTKIIETQNKFPLTYNPVMPISFGAYPIGFHTISAYISILSNLVVYKSTWLLATFTYALLTISLYLFLRNYFDKKISFLTSLILSFVPNNPQLFISWGGNPFILSVALLFFSIGIIEKFPKLTIFDQISSMLLLVASIFTHTIPAYGFFYIYLPYFIFKNSNTKIKKIIKKAFPLAIILILLMIPYILSFNTKVSNKEISWSKNRQETKFFSWKGNYLNFLITIPIFLKLVFGINILLIILFAFVVNFNETLVKRSFIMYLTTNIVILSSKYWFLPFSFLLFSERIAILLLIPFSLIIATMFKKFFENKQLILTSLILIFFILISFINVQNTIKSSKTFSMVTKNDLLGMDFILKNTDPNSMFITNYGDAGAWIPALTLRKASNIHISSAYFDEFDEYISTQTPKYVFIGEKPTYIISLNLNDYLNSNYEQIFNSGETYIFKIK